MGYLLNRINNGRIWDAIFMYIIFVTLVFFVLFRFVMTLARNLSKFSSISPLGCKIVPRRLISAERGIEGCDVGVGRVTSSDEVGAGVEVIGDGDKIEEGMSKVRLLSVGLLIYRLVMSSLVFVLAVVL